MFSVVLYHPEIPQNSGNIIRLAANTGATLHLIEPLGYSLEDGKLKRAGLDYHDLAAVEIHPDLDDWRRTAQPTRVFALTGKADQFYTNCKFEAGDTFLLGPESVGLPDDVLQAAWITARLRIPMLPGVRSLNLANVVALVLYEAWRQTGFQDGV